MPTSPTPIALYGFGRFLGTPDSSPFVMKAMLLMKLCGRPYHMVEGGLTKAPKGKLPFIDDDGTIVADSTFIRAHLEARCGCDFDAGLSRDEKAVAWAVERMCEDHLYFALLSLRWGDRRNFRKGIARMFAIVPWPVRPFVKAVMRRRTVQRVVAHGLGDHSKTEVSTLAIRDLEAISTLLGNKAFLFGDKPCGADATLFGIVTSFLTPELASPIVSSALKTQNLVAYRDRILATYFPETR